MIVADIVDVELLGIDWIQCHGVLTDFNQRILPVIDETVPMVVPNSFRNHHRKFIFGGNSSDVWKPS